MATKLKKIDARLDVLLEQDQCLTRFYSCLMKTTDFYIVGGFIRDALMEKEKSRDLDILVETNIENIIAVMPPEVSVTKNSMNGLKLNFSNITVDVWGFEDNWAFKNKFVPATKENISEGCFFNIDSLVYSPVTKFFDWEKYSEAINTKILDLNSADPEYFTSNPKKSVNGQRAKSLAKKYGLSFSERLKKLFESESSESFIVPLRKVS